VTTVAREGARACPAAPDVLMADHLPLSRFHVATLAFQRAKQLHHGARPRVNGAGRQSWRVALLEVEADQVGWYLP
jgi:hypothetical protein